jgi:hypothetical protein
MEESRLLIIHIVDGETKHLQAFPTDLFPQRRRTAALCRFGRTGKTSRIFTDGDSCRSDSPFASRAPQEKSKGWCTPCKCFFLRLFCEEKEQTQVWNPLLLLLKVNDYG